MSKKDMSSDKIVYRKTIDHVVNGISSTFDSEWIKGEYVGDGTFKALEEIKPKYQIGDRVRFFGYTEEAYRNGSVPTFMQNEGTLMWLDNQWYVKLANEWILPLYYCANIEIIPSQKVSPIRRT